jgi:hypothetical protein
METSSLIDVMRQRGNNEFTPDGLELFRKRLTYPTGVTVWVVTGYERKFREWLQDESIPLPEHLSQSFYDWLFVKPIDSVAFSAKLDQKLGVR